MDVMKKPTLLQSDPKLLINVGSKLIQVRWVIKSKLMSLNSHKAIHVDAWISRRVIGN